MSFTPDVYEKIREGAKRSAAVIVPAVHKLVRPDTVIDVGCGEGWFAREFAKLGCEVVGADESVAEEDSGSVIDGVTFFKRTLPQGFTMNYDLAVCLEVAEHLPEEDAGRLVRSLCEAAPVVLFSAAIPNQGGLGHINEQWPAYWASLFRLHDYTVADIRDRFWDDGRIEPWYRQNLLIFGSLAADWMTNSRLRELSELPTTKKPCALVHPDIYGWRVEERDRLHKILYAPGDDDGTVWNGP